MFRNYLKITIRGLIKHRVYSLINITGLAVGMAVALLIGLWINHEFSYDRFLPDYDRLYQLKVNHVQEGEIQTQDALSLPVVETLREKIPGIAYVAECDWMQRHGLKVGEEKLFISGARTGSDFLKIFGFPMRQGQPDQALRDLYSIVLTESTATALFGEENPMGKTVRYDNQFDLKVTGILADLPANATFYFRYLVPFALYEQNTPWVKAARTQWDNFSFQVFTALLPEVSSDQIAGQIRNMLKNNSPELAEYDMELILHPIKDRHLYNEFKDGRASGGYIDYIRMFGLIGFLVLLLACINFTNLATARSEKRAKEVGVRKAIGSKRKHLVTQFMVESFLITALAGALSLLLVFLALPFFNELVEKDLYLPFNRIWFWFSLLVFLSVTAIIAGSRPALYLSSFRAVEVLKGHLKTGKTAASGRKALVLVQFSCSIALIIGTLVIYRQIQYVQDRPVGYERDRLLMTRMNDDMMDNYDALKNELLQSGVVESVTWSSSPITDIFSQLTLQHWPGKRDDELSPGIALVRVTDDYFQTVGMKLLSGRQFRPNWRADSTSVILNQAAAKRLGLEDPLHQTLTFTGGDKAAVVGLVNDALMTSPYEPAKPTIFLHGRRGGSMLYRLSPGRNTQEAIRSLAPIFDRHNPAFPYEYEFVDDTFAYKFQLEVLIGRLAGIFAGLAIFVSCLGLFGLATYLAEQRRKEIGIRKVLGATLGQIWMLLSREFVGLVVLSCLIAVPLAYYFLHNWLQQYSYRVGISAAVFGIAGLLAVLITLITISFQAIRAGREHPAKSLRAE